MLINPNPGMHPILLRLQLPSEQLPLASLLLAVAVVSGVVAFAGWHRNTQRVTVIGTAVAIVAVGAAVHVGSARLALGELVLGSYGVLLFLGVAAGLSLARDLGSQDGLAPELTLRVGLLSLLGGLLVARLGYVLTQGVPIAELLQMSRGGLSLPAGLLGGVLICGVLLRQLGKSFWLFADAAAPGVALALILGRTGCYLHGCDAGRPLSGGDGWLAALGRFPGASSALHATQLYFAAGGAALLVLCVWLRPRRRFLGQVILMAGLSYAYLLVIVEPFRGAADRVELGWSLSQSHFLGLGLAFLGVCLALGPAAMLRNPRWRVGVQLAGLLPALGAFLSREPAAVKLTLSTAFALLLALVTTLAWRARRPALSPAPSK